MSALVRHALGVIQANLALGNEVFQAEGASFVRNRAAPRIRDANHVADVTASTSAEIDRLLVRVEREFAGTPHREFHLGPDAPPAFAARLAGGGYERSDHLAMMLEGALAAEPTPYDLRPVADEAAWAGFFGLHRTAWAEQMARLGHALDERVGEEMARTKRAKSPPVRYWLAYVNQPIGYCSSWKRIGGIGQVEDLFVHPAWRHRGVATALVYRSVEACRAEGAGPIVLVADPTDTPRHMYAAMGFRTLATTRKHWRSAAR